MFRREMSEEVNFSTQQILVRALPTSATWKFASHDSKECKTFAAAADEREEARRYGLARGWGGRLDVLDEYKAPEGENAPGEEDI